MMALAPGVGAIEIHDACHELAPELEKRDQLGSLPNVARLNVACAYRKPACTTVATRIGCNEVASGSAGSDPVNAAGVAQAVNSALVLLYWQVGHRIRTEILKSRRAEYGEQVVPTLANQLALEFGQGFAEKNLRRMIQLAEVFPDREIVVTLSRQLGWSHFLAILPLRDPLQRDFYAEMCRMERWSIRTLLAKISGMLFERTALSNKPKLLVEQELAKLREGDMLTPDLVFRDPYFLDFLGLKDAYSEKDLESAILPEMEQFILELGGRVFIRRPAETDHNRRRGFLSRLAILSPETPAIGGRRAKTRAVQGRR